MGMCESCGPMPLGEKMYLYDHITWCRACMISMDQEVDSFKKLTKHVVRKINDKVENEGLDYYLTDYSSELKGTEIEPALIRYLDARKEILKKLQAIGACDWI